MNDNHFAVVVGITHYPGVGPLGGPVNDAEAFALWLLDPLHGNVPKYNIVSVTTPPGAESMTLDTAVPTRQLIDDALWNVTTAARKKVAQLGPAARATSRLYIFVAGHGIMPGTGQAALLAARATRGRMENVELRSYQDWYQLDGTFAEVCIFADCCRSYEPLVSPGGPTFDAPATAGGTVYSVIGYAAEPNKLAQEDSVPADQRRGYFSRALVDGLNGAARDDQGYVTSVSLSRYLSDTVPLLTHHLPDYKRQSVQMLVDPSRPIRFGSQHVPAAGMRLHPVRISFPEGFDGDVDLLRPDGSRVSWDASLGPWELDLRDGIYLVTHPGGFSTEGFSGNGTFDVIGARDVQL